VFATAEVYPANSMPGQKYDWKMQNQSFSL
jgi:hypothetical protein